MGNFNRDDTRTGGYRGGFNRGGGRNFGRGEGRGARRMFDATCSNCGKACQVPFRPTGSKPVYCSDCFEKMGSGRPDSRRFEDRNHAPQAQSESDLGAINAKLDKILNILEPKVVAPATPAPVTKEEKIADKVDLSKIKKVVKKVAKKAASTKKK